MRTVAIAVSLGALCATATPAAAQFDYFRAQFDYFRWQEPGFEVNRCASNATHILVVEPSGRVAEVWKGNATVGDWVPVERLLGSSLARLALASPNQGSPFRPFEPNWRFDPFQDRGRLILFLVKSDEQNEASKFLHGWLPAAPSGWFLSSTARVDPFGYVWGQPAPWIMNMPESGYRGSEDSFKGWVFGSIKSLPVDPKK